jgi:hypothetical protein
MKRKGEGKGSKILMIIKTVNGVHGGAVGCDTALKGGRSRIFSLT